MSYKAHTSSPPLRDQINNSITRKARSEEGVMFEVSEAGGPVRLQSLRDLLGMPQPPEGVQSPKSLTLRV